MKESIEQMDILKLDTEGHELPCLRGLFNQNPRKIALKLNMALVILMNVFIQNSPSNNRFLK